MMENLTENLKQLWAKYLGTPRSDAQFDLWLELHTADGCRHTMQMPKANHINPEVLKAAKKLLRSEPCPKCASPVALREGKFGQFWGCCNFPNCRYTASVPQETVQETDEVLAGMFE